MDPRHRVQHPRRPRSPRGDTARPATPAADREHRGRRDSGAVPPAILSGRTRKANSYGPGRGRRADSAMPPPGARATPQLPRCPPAGRAPQVPEGRAAAMGLGGQGMWGRAGAMGPRAPAATPPAAEGDPDPAAQRDERVFLLAVGAVAAAEVAVLLLALPLLAWRLLL